MRLRFENLPFITCAQKYAQDWTFPGGASDNRSYYGPQVRFNSEITEMNQMLTFDPQTSGGLLLAVPPEKLNAFQKRARELGQPIWLIGEAVPGSGIEVFA